VGAGGDAGLGAAEGEEREAVGPQVVHERAALGGVRVHGHVERVAVIEAEPVVHGGLAPRADRQRVAEARVEEALEGGQGRQRPALAARVADQRGPLLRLAGYRRR